MNLQDKRISITEEMKGEISAESCRTEVLETASATAAV